MPPTHSARQICKRLIPLLALPLGAGCIIIDDDDPMGGGGTTVASDPVEGELSLDEEMAALASVCSYHQLWMANQEAVLDPNDAGDLYEITAGCRAELEGLLDRHMTFHNFEVPGGQEARDTIVDGVHAYLFMPLFLPPTEPTLGAPAVFRGAGAAFPFPGTLVASIPPVPASYDFALTEDGYNAPQAQYLFELVQGFVFNPGSNPDGTTVARWLGGDIEVFGQFIAAVNDPLHAAEVLHHEMSHASAPGHVPCAVDWQPDGQGGGGCFIGPNDTGDCDCGYPASAYWDGLAFHQAATLGGLISHHPATDEPILGGLLVNRLSDALCVQAVMHIHQFEAEVVAAPDFTCSSANEFLIGELQANNAYWYQDYCGNGICSEDEAYLEACPEDCD